MSGEASGSLDERMRKIEVNLIRGQIVKRLVGALSVVELEPLAKALSEFGTIVKRPKVKILVFERPPESLDENIVLNTATAVHADLHFVRLEQFGKITAGKLGALVGIEDFRATITAEGFFNGLDTKFGIQGKIAKR